MLGWRTHQPGLQLDVSQLPFEPLTAVSPLDGRYRRVTEQLAPYASEFALIRYRLRVEVEWFLYLDQLRIATSEPALGQELVENCRQIWKEFSIEDARTVRKIEQETNHDVKAVERFLRGKLVELGLGSRLESVHFGCTSEDINNLAYGLMLQEVRSQILLPTLNELILDIVNFGEPLVAVPMLARTHGQTASPTTVGKELAVFASRLHECSLKLINEPLLGKMNGAVGNYNAHVVAEPNVDWPRVGNTFVELLGLEHNPTTTQIEPHDYVARILNHVRGCNVVALDFVRDMWSYISIGYFRQRKKSGEVGSSTMPHKVNPIDFENAEGNLGVADSILSHLAEKLPVSRWQRDLSDSTAFRNLGVAFGHSLIAYRSAMRGIGKLDPDTDRLEGDLNEAWEVLTEAVQTVMRIEGVSDPYEKVRELVRGRTLDQTSYVEMLAKLQLSDDSRRSLEQLTPSSYVGMASEIATQAFEKIKFDRVGFEV